jgi:hypothetical protein
MSQINLNNLSFEQRDCLGQVYRFIIERGRENRRKIREEPNIVPEADIATNNAIGDQGVMLALPLTAP